MNNWTRFFLILLRLAIGWHLATEGWTKIQSLHRWTGEKNQLFAGRPFSGRTYLQEAEGPFRETFRRLAPDPYRWLEARLNTRVPAGKNPKDIDPLERFPRALGRDWDRYLDEFLKHYEVVGEQHQLFRNELATQKKATADWLAGLSKDEPRELRRETLWGRWTVTLTVPQRIEEFRHKLAEMEDVEEERLLFNSPVAVERQRRLRAETELCYIELYEDLIKGREGYDSRFQIMQKALEKHLTAEQKKKGRPAGYVSEEPFFLGHTRLWWSDRITAYGLFAAGLALIVGLFTRTGCVAGAVLLVLFYAARPVLPWLPPAPNSEGTYFFVNKTLIEAVALLVLATTRSGLWLGLDAGLNLVWRAWFSKKPPELTT